MPSSKKTHWLLYGLCILKFFSHELNPAREHDILSIKRGWWSFKKNILVVSLCLALKTLHLQLLQLFLNCTELCFCVRISLRLRLGFHLGLLASVCQVLCALVTTRVPWHFSLLLLYIGFVLRWREERMLVRQRECKLSICNENTKNKNQKASLDGFLVALQSLSNSVAFSIFNRCSGSVMFSSFRWDSFRPLKSSKLWKPCMDRRDPSSWTNSEISQIRSYYTVM